jgi:hypothetical protein
MPFRLRHPLATNPRVKNLFERAPLGRVIKYYRSKFRSIQVPCRRKDFTAKLTQYFLFHFWKFGERTRCQIRIEEFRSGQDLPHAVTERAFAGGYSARDPDRRHSQASPRCNTFGEINVKRLFHLRCAES